MKKVGRQSVGLPIGLILPALVFLCCFYVLPLLWNIRTSVPTVAIGGANYGKLLTDPYYVHVLLTTIGLSAGVTAISVVLGYPVAFFLVRVAGRWSGLVIFMLIAPLLTSIVMRTYGWRVIFARQGVFNTALIGLGVIDRPLVLLDNPVAAVVGLVHVLVPFVVISIAASLQNAGLRLEESARILGAGKVATFLNITLPLTLDGVATGTILVFMLANGSFVTLLFLGGGSLPTLSLLIYQQFQTTRDFAFAAAMSNILLVLSVAGLWAQLHLIRRKGASR